MLTFSTFFYSQYFWYLIFSIFDRSTSCKKVNIAWFFTSNQTYTALRYVDILQIVNIFNISIFQQPKIYLWQRPKMVKNIHYIFLKEKIWIPHFDPKKLHICATSRLHILSHSALDSITINHALEISVVWVKVVESVAIFTTEKENITKPLPLFELLLLPGLPGPLLAASLQKKEASILKKRVNWFLQH